MATTDDLREGRRLELLTLGWNVVEAAVSIAAGLFAGSTALVGFGVDSLNALLGWWWADSVAALCMVPIIVNEGLEALRGERCETCS